MNKHIFSVGVALLLLGQVLPVAAGSTDHPLSFKARVEEYLSGCPWSSHYQKPSATDLAEDRAQPDTRREDGAELVKDSLALRTRLEQLLTQQRAEPKPLKVPALKALPKKTEAAPQLTLPQIKMEEQRLKEQALAKEVVAEQDLTEPLKADLPLAEQLVEAELEQTAETPQPEVLQLAADSPKEQEENPKVALPESLLEILPKTAPIPLKAESQEEATSQLTPRPAGQLVEQQVEVVDESSSLPETLDNHVLTLEYRSGTVATVPVKADFLTDVQLQPGERLERITLGDAEDWQVQSFLDEAKNTYHVYLKPLYEDASSNIILSTDRHSYQLELVQEEEPTPIVRWYYPLEEEQDQLAPRLLPQVEPEQLCFDYHVERKAYLPWQPRQVFDDGSHTYLVMDPEALKAVNPAIFTRTSQGELVLVDYEKINNNLVIGAILDNLQLHVEHTVLNIQRRKGHV